MALFILNLPGHFIAKPTLHKDRLDKETLLILPEHKVLNQI